MANCSQEEKCQRARALVRQREAIEEEIKSITANLTGPGGPGLHGNLLDSEGFPRADLDIPSVRSQRHRIARLYTDHRNITDELEELLHSIFEKGNVSNIVPQSSSTNRKEGTPNNLQPQRSEFASVPLAPVDKPFAVVDRIVPDSPADHAGLKDGDRIIAFANISTETQASEAEAYRALAATVRDLLYVSVPVAVERIQPGTDQTVMLHLNITPMPWDGPGLLGCGIHQFSLERGTQ